MSVHLVGVSHRRGLTGVHLICVHLTGTHLIGVWFIGVYLIGVYLTGVYVMGMHLIGMHLIGVYTMGVHFMGVHHRMQSFLLSRTYVFAAFGSPGLMPHFYSADPDVVSDDHCNAAASAPDLMPSGQESSLKLLGGDIHRDLYKINAGAKLHQRAATFSHLSPRASGFATPGSNGEMAAAEQRAPGGFC